VVVAATAPSGQQHEIRYGDQRAVVVEVGAGLRDYWAGERRLFDGYAADEMCDGARGQTLVPWPNRLASGRYTWDGQQHQVALTEPELGGAIHGLCRWVNWAVRERSEDAVTLGYRLPPQYGWPFPLDVTVSYWLGAGGLTVRTAATNQGAEPAPYAQGAHPYLTLGDPVIDDDELRVPAATYYPVDQAMIPTGCDPVEGTEYDFRESRRIGGTQIDRAFTDLDRDPDGRARVRLTRPGGPWVALWVDEHYPYVEIFTGDALSRADRRRTGVGVEPMTSAPNGLATGDGRLTLDPGQTFTAAWGIEYGG
jgi:aldose 1-epimerase